MLAWMHTNLHEELQMGTSVFPRRLRNASHLQSFARYLKHRSAEWVSVWFTTGSPNFAPKILGRFCRCPLMLWHTLFWGQDCQVHSFSQGRPGDFVIVFPAGSLCEGNCESSTNVRDVRTKLGMVPMMGHH